MNSPPYRAALAGLGLILLAACSRSSASNAAPPGPEVAGNRVTFTPGAPQISSFVVVAAEPATNLVQRVTGRLIWNEDATVRVYAPVAGRVISIEARLGSPVGAGAPLARIDSPDYGQALADARRAAADLLLAQRTLARTRDLQIHGAAPLKDLEAAEDGAADAEAEQQRATARLALYGSTDSSPTDEVFTLRAPLTGVVVEKNINPGQEIRPDLMLANANQLVAPQFVLSDPARLWVLLDITESDMAGLREGEALQIRSRAFPDRTFAGKIDNIGHALDPTTRTVLVRGSVDNPDLALKAEMYVDVDIDQPAAAHDAVMVASSAVLTKAQQAYVFVELTPGSYERREVRAGTETAGRIVITHGLRPGDRVLVEGPLLLEDILEGEGTP